MIEAGQHTDNAFVTLTYADDQLPDGNSLCPEDVTKFLKRLRKRIDPVKIRYFLCGEYGEGSTSRPHYHLILFGLPSCVRVGS